MGLVPLKNRLEIFALFVSRQCENTAKDSHAQVRKPLQASRIVSNLFSLNHQFMIFCHSNLNRLRQSVPLPLSPQRIFLFGVLRTKER